MHENDNLVGFRRGGAEHLLPLFADAGFVDVEVYRASVDNGPWRKGYLSSGVELSWIDQSPKMAAASRKALIAFNAIPSLMDKLRPFIPDDEERKKFTERAIVDLSRGKCHTSFNMHEILFYCSDIRIVRP